jgi:hypothetical protein
MKKWKNRSYCSNLLSEGLTSIKAAYREIISSRAVCEMQPPESPLSAVSTGSNSFFFADDSPLVDNNEAAENLLNDELTRVLEEYSKTISCLAKLNKVRSTYQFWNTNINRTPKLY